jgi:hypothetical protein
MIGYLKIELILVALNIDNMSALQIEINLENSLTEFKKRRSTAIERQPCPTFPLAYELMEFFNAYIRGEYDDIEELAGTLEQLGMDALLLCSDSQVKEN